MASVLQPPFPPGGAALATGLAIFDLDRTLVRGSSLARLARALAEARILRRRHLAGHLARETVFAVRGMGPAAIERLCRSLLHAATGLEQAPLVEVATRIGTSIAADVFPGARWLLDRHLDAGEPVVLLSSSPHELVTAVAEAIDPTIIPVGTVAEVVDGRYTGLLEGPFCHGAGKLERLHATIGRHDLRHATAYAASNSDLPVLRAAGNPVAVNPDRALRAAAASAGWPILDLS